MIHINKRINVVFALCLASTFSMQGDQGLASSPVSDTTTNTILVDPITPIADPITPIKMPTDTVREGSEPRVSFEGVPTDESPSRPSTDESPSRPYSRSPSKRSQQPTASFAGILKNPQKPYILSDFGSALSVRHGDRQSIVVPWAKAPEVLNLPQNELQRFVAAVFEALAGGSGIFCLEKKGRFNYVMNGNQNYYALDAFVYFTFPFKRGEERLLFANSQGEHVIFNKSDFDEFSIDDPILFANALAAQLALANYNKIGIDLLKGSNIQMSFLPYIEGANLIIYDTKAKVFYIASNTEVTEIKSQNKERYNKLQAAWKDLDSFFVIKGGQVHFKDQLIIEDLAAVINAALVTDDIGLDFFEVLAHKCLNQNTVLNRNGKYYIMPPNYTPGGVAQHPYRQECLNQGLGFTHNTIPYDDIKKGINERLATMEIKAPSRSSSAASLGSSAAG